MFTARIYQSTRRWNWLRDQARYADAARGAAAVTTVNEYLAAGARERNADVTVIPTPVDTTVYVPRSGPRPSGPLVIGWISSSTTAPYLLLLDALLHRVARRL